MKGRWLLLASLLLSPAAHAAPERWAVYYTDALPAEAFAAYDLLVFDSDNHPPTRSPEAAQQQ